jgi:23S rRNA pseudouridine1911/1915/1917 synthase
VDRPTEELISVNLTVDPQYDGWRLDHFIKARIPRLSRTRIQEMIQSQEKLAGQQLRPSMKVRAHQQLVLLRPAPWEPDVPRTFEMLYEDGHLAAINKPAGLPVHATARFHRNTLTAVLRETFTDRPVPVLAHRLDRETSGLMLLGLTRQMGIALKALFRQRGVHKRYLAIVMGQSPPEGVVDLPLGPDVASGIRVKMGVVPDGQPARTRFRTLEHCADFSLVEAFPETGRQHQIRAHLSALGHPVVGDKLYGQDPGCLLEFIETGWTASLQRRLLLDRQALHAAEACFIHPATKVQIRLSCPLAGDLHAFWEKAGGSPISENATIS